VSQCSLVRTRGVMYQRPTDTEQVMDEPLHNKKQIRPYGFLFPYKLEVVFFFLFFKQCVGVG
jgi:hypothetical protein